MTAKDYALDNCGDQEKTICRVRENSWPFQTGRLPKEAVHLVEESLELPEKEFREAREVLESASTARQWLRNELRKSQWAIVVGLMLSRLENSSFASD
ncbi:hypothetical protein N7510_005183 [Penicillium lagena]|uniref:uncharacterized protein n=1 Tax=Penicillium lagena TaxID=94218 RepID=UPI002540463D|nr:uncharacterized protein N7510_005183 [Penicillium lagena]KAJ5611989.1 hypothetical protein N7510_005183 [Penicillium lagena]